MFSCQGRSQPVAVDAMLAGAEHVHVVLAVLDADHVLHAQTRRARLRLDDLRPARDRSEALQVIRGTKTEGGNEPVVVTTEPVRSVTADVLQDLAALLLAQRPAGQLAGPVVFPLLGVAPTWSRLIDVTCRFLLDQEAIVRGSLGQQFNLLLIPDFVGLPDAATIRVPHYQHVREFHNQFSSELGLMRQRLQACRRSLPRSSALASAARTRAMSRIAEHLQQVHMGLGLVGPLQAQKAQGVSASPSCALSNSLIKVRSRTNDRPLNLGMSDPEGVI